MTMGVASRAVGQAAAAIGCGDEAGGGATSEAAGKEGPMPAEGVPGMGEEGKGAAAPVEGAEADEEEGEEDDEEEEEEPEGEEEEEGEKWLKHYSSTQSILLVGDGDFSFSLALATAFRSGANLVATSLDTYEDLKAKYSKAESNIMELKRLGTMILHGIDVKTMKLHTDLKNRRFDRVVFNFPHAGFKGREDQVHLINLHKKLVRNFFCSAFHMLRPYGEIHVSHKIGQPYDKWELESLASEFSLIMLEKVYFHKKDYPGYNQKRGSGPRCDDDFPLGPCCTFKFQIGDLNKQKKPNQNRVGPVSLTGGNNIRADILANNTTPFHPSPLVQAWPWLHFPSSVQAWPWLHFPPPVNTVHMLSTLQHCVAAQRQQPGFSQNFSGTVRTPYIHQQGAIQPMLSMPGPSLNALPAPGGIPPMGRMMPSLNALPAPGGIPPMGRMARPNLLAPQEQPWYQQRAIADPPGRDNYSDYQLSLQREREMQRQAMMSGASGIPPMGRTARPNLLAPQEHPSYQQSAIADPPGRDNCSYFDYQLSLQREREMQRQAMKCRVGVREI